LDVAGALAGRPGAMVSPMPGRTAGRQAPTTAPTGAAKWTRTDHSVKLAAIDGPPAAAHRDPHEVEWLVVATRAQSIRLSMTRSNALSHRYATDLVGPRNPLVAGERTGQGGSAG